MIPKRRMPTHPGKVLSEEFLKPHGISPSGLADQLGKDWKTDRVEALIRGEEHLTNEDAEKLASIFNTPVQLWTQLQKIFDEAKKHSHAKRKPE